MKIFESLLCGDIATLGAKGTPKSPEDQAICLTILIVAVLLYPLIRWLERPKKRKDKQEDD